MIPCLNHARAGETAPAVWILSVCADVEAVEEAEVKWRARFCFQASTDHNHIWHLTTYSTNEEGPKKQVNKQRTLFLADWQACRTTRVHIVTSLNTTLGATALRERQTEALLQSCGAARPTAKLRYVTYGYILLSNIILNIYLYIYDFAGKREKKLYQYIHDKHFILQGGKKRRLSLIDRGRGARSPR